MNCRYWDTKANGVVANLMKKENSLIALAKKLEIDHTKVVIEYNRKVSMFERWHEEDTIGVVEESAGEIRVVINGNLLSNYIQGNALPGQLQNEAEANEYMAKIYTMMAATVLSEYLVKQSKRYDEVMAGLEDNFKFLAYVYIAARIRMQVPEIKKLVTMVPDPYVYSSYGTLNELEWRELFNSVAYYTESCKSEPKSFLGAMAIKEPGKILQQPNQLDKFVKTLEGRYDAYMK